MKKFTQSPTKRSCIAWYTSFVFFYKKGKKKKCLTRKKQMFNTSSLQLIQKLSFEGGKHDVYRHWNSLLGTWRNIWEREGGAIHIFDGPSHLFSDGKKFKNLGAAPQVEIPRSAHANLMCLPQITVNVSYYLLVIRFNNFGRVIYAQK